MDFVQKWEPLIHREGICAKMLAGSIFEGEKKENPKRGVVS